MLDTLKTNHGVLKFPVFFPDATEGVVKSVDSVDLENCKVQGLVTNAYHLLRIGLVDKIAEAGGIHKYMNFHKPIISDSGGFQVMSLVRDNNFGEIHDDKIVFKLNGQKTILTPEKSIRAQFKIGSDIIMCLDDCTRYTDSREQQEKAVKRTIEWARRSKNEFEKLVKNSKSSSKPLIFGIIQGGNNKDLREYCAKELIKIGFDGYGFGGWPIDENGNLLKELIKFVADLIPDNLPKYAMGIGDPRTLVECYKMGYDIFDCIVPTREARRQRIYYFKKNPDKIKNLDEDFYDYFTIKSSKYSKDMTPVSEYCDCQTCKTYTKAYLHNLFKIKEPLAMRLATIHNLRFYSKLMEMLRRFNQNKGN